MVELTAPTARDVICDPAAGTCGFLVAAGEYLRRRHPEILRSEKSRAHFHHGMFHGYDFDHTMLRIGSMNMELHGVEGPDIRYRDSLAQEHSDDAEAYTLILANPPFAGSLDYDATAKDLQAIVKTKKTELLFMALFLRLLKPGGRAAVVVPDGVLFGSSKAHKELRRLLVDGHKLDAVISLPGGVFKPYAGVSTAILLFTKTDSGGTDWHSRTPFLAARNVTERAQRHQRRARHCRLGYRPRGDRRTHSWLGLSRSSRTGHSRRGSRSPRPAERLLRLRRIERLPWHSERHRSSCQHDRARPNSRGACRRHRE